MRVSLKLYVALVAFSATTMGAKVLSSTDMCLRLFSDAFREAKPVSVKGSGIDEGPAKIEQGPIEINKTSTDDNDQDSKTLKQSAPQVVNLPESTIDNSNKQPETPIKTNNSSVKQPLSNQAHVLNKFSMSPDLMSDLQKGVKGHRVGQSSSDEDEWSAQSDGD